MYKYTFSCCGRLLVNHWLKIYKSRNSSLLGFYLPFLIQHFSKSSGQFSQDCSAVPFVSKQYIQSPDQEEFFF